MILEFPVEDRGLGEYPNVAFPKREVI